MDEAFSDEFWGSNSRTSMMQKTERISWNPRSLPSDMLIMSVSFLDITTFL